MIFHRIGSPLIISEITGAQFICSTEMAAFQARSVFLGACARMAPLVQLGSSIFVPNSALTSFLSILGRRLIFPFRVFLISDHWAHSYFSRSDYGPVVPLPNTDPGLAGETGTSGVAGTVYGVEGFNTGGGIEGA
jgi:hypothetical protein